MKYKYIDFRTCGEIFFLYLKRYIDRIKGKTLDRQGWEGFLYELGLHCDIESSSGVPTREESSGFAGLGFKRCAV